MKQREHEVPNRGRANALDRGQNRSRRSLRSAIRMTTTTTRTATTKTTKKKTTIPFWQIHKRQCIAHGAA